VGESRVPITRAAEFQQREGNRAPAGGEEDMSPTGKGQGKIPAGIGGRVLSRERWIGFQKGKGRVAAIRGDRYRQVE
jgi:hypothetical protein